MDLGFTGQKLIKSDVGFTARLLFSGGHEGYFFALDARNGKLLWKAPLGGEVRSGPMTFMVNGRQYVAVDAGNSLFVWALRQ